MLIAVLRYISKHSIYFWNRNCSCERSDFNYGTRYQELRGRGKYPLTTWLTGPVLAQGELTLLKLHGSISLTEIGYCTDGRGGITGKAIIIPPTHNKQIFDIISPVWDNAKIILKNSETIVFFGFAFNPYDQDILNLFRETESRIKKVILINTNSDVEQSAQKIWSNAEIMRIDPEDIQKISQLL